MGIAVFMWGLFAASVQVLLLREYVTAASGNELALGIFFSSWLFGAGVGSFVSGRLVRLTPLVPIVALAFAAPVLSALSVVTLSLSGSIFNVLPGTVLGVAGCFRLAMFSVLPVAFTTGAYFPHAARLMEPRAGDSTGSGRAFWIEGAGMTAGACLSALVLVVHVNVLSAIASLGAAHALALYFSWTLTGSWRRATLLAAALFSWSIPFSESLDENLMSKRFSSFGGGFSRVSGKDTAYARYDLGEREGEYALYINGKTAATFPDPYRSTPLAMLSLLEAGNPDKILLVGAASFELASSLSGGAGKSLDLVEIDPMLPAFLELSLGYRVYPSGDRIKLHFMDGREYLRETPPGTYDLVVVDVPDPDSSLLNRYFTSEFFQLASRALSDGGVMVVSAGSAAGLMGSENAERIASIAASFRSAFPERIIASGERLTFLGSKKLGVISSDLETLASRSTGRFAKGVEFDPAGLAPFLQPSQLSMIEKAAGKIRDPAPNTDMHPSAFIRGVSIWGATSGGSAPNSIASPFVFAGAMAGAGLAILALVFVVARRGTRRFLAVVSVSGAAGICAELVAITALQINRGALYTTAGVIIAACMGGMSAGGYLGLRIARAGASKNAPFAFMVLAGLCLPLIPLVIPALSGAGNATALIIVSLLAFICSASAAVSFPVAAAGLKRLGADAGRLAAILEFFECTASGSAAIAFSVVMVPTLGMTCASVVMALVCLVAATAWLTVDTAKKR